MYVAREKAQGGREVAIRRVGFCLDQLEKGQFHKGFDMGTEVATRLSLEEMIGALVAAEQALQEEDDDG